MGVEMAQAYRRLGAAEVTVVEAGERLMSRYEPWVGELLAEVFRDEGISVLTGRRADRVERAGVDGPVTLTLDDGTTLVGDELLVTSLAGGRRQHRLRRPQPCSRATTLRWVSALPSAGVEAALSTASVSHLKFAR